MKGSLRKEPVSEERSFPVFLALLCLILYIPHIGGRDLWCGRETLYAEVARDILLNGHWFVPYFNGELYYNKPPLFFWLIAFASMPAGDITEFTLRLPGALSALGTVLVVYYLGRRIYNARAGFLAGIILATSPGFYKYACVAKLESPLTLFITASIAAFYLGFAGSSNTKKWYFLSGWFLMGLAMLTKGLGVMLIAPVILLYLASRRELGRVWEMKPVLGGLVLLATMGVWLLPGYLIGGPEYIEGLIGHFGYHIGKGLSFKKFLYYVTESFVGTLPWSLIFPALFFYFYRRRDGVDAGQKEALRLSAVWFVAMWIVFSLIMAKRSRYILPMYPAVALAAGIVWEECIARASETWSKIKLIPIVIFSFLAGTAVVLVRYHFIVLTPVVGGMVALCLIVLFSGWFLSVRSGQYKALFISFLIVIISFETTYLHLALPIESQAGAEKAVCEKALANMEPGARWTLYKYFSPDFVFYGRTNIKSIGTEGDLANFLSSKERVYCIIKEADYAELDLSAFNVSAFKITELKKVGKRTTMFLLISNRPNKAGPVSTGTKI